MNVHISYFGEIAEWAHTHSENIHLVENMDIEELKSYFVNRFPQLRTISYSIAINNVLVGTNCKVVNGDSVALFPPFAGG